MTRCSCSGFSHFASYGDDFTFARTKRKRIFSHSLHRKVLYNSQKVKKYLPYFFECGRSKRDFPKREKFFSAKSMRSEIRKKKVCGLQKRCFWLITLCFFILFIQFKFFGFYLFMFGRLHFMPNWNGPSNKFET